MSISRSAVWRALCRDRWRATLALLTCTVLLTLRIPRTGSLVADFPQHTPRALAHFLADFSNHPRLYSHITGTWSIGEDKHNYTSWHYVVSYECGARCTGRVELTAHDVGANQHLVHIRDTQCSGLLFFPWPQICDNTVIETAISPRRGGGARLEEVTRVQCGVLALATSCDVHAARRSHLRALREALAQEM